jgi:hypothetical protein
MTLGKIRKPLTDIQKLLTKAVKVSATTKIGNMLNISIINDSAAIKSRNSHMIKVM